MRRLPTVVTVTGLLLALTAGSAGAGALITGARIKDDTVTGADVRDQNLTGTDVRDGSLTLADLVGLPPGPKGVPGPPGAPGTDGLPGVVQRTDLGTLVPGERRRLTARCNPGETAVSGGVAADRAGVLLVEESFPDGFFWTVQVRSTASTTVTADVWALCAPI